MRAECVPGIEEVNCLKPGESGRAECAIELGLSVEKCDIVRDPGGAGGAAQGVKGGRARCVPGVDAIKSDEEAVAEMGLSVATGAAQGEKEGRARCVPGGDVVKSDEEAVAEMRLSVAKDEIMRIESDYRKRKAFLTKNMEEFKNEIDVLKKKKSENEYFKLMFKSEEKDLENFGLAEAIVTEIVKRSSDLISEREIDRKMKNEKKKKKRKLTDNCDNPTTTQKEKEISSKNKSLTIFMT